MYVICNSSAFKDGGAFIRLPTVVPQATVPFLARWQDLIFHWYTSYPRKDDIRYREDHLPDLERQHYFFQVL